MSDAGGPGEDGGRAPLIERVSGAIAVLGGALSLGVAMLVVVSVLGRWLGDAPITGDFELVQMATAVAVFALPALLPGAPRQHRGRHLHELAAGAGDGRDRRVLGARLRRHGGADGAWLIAGTLEHFRSGQTTMVLRLPIWPAIALCAALALLLAGVTLARAVRLLRGRA